MKMDLKLPEAPSHYKSASRKAGAAAESWAAKELFCPSCRSNRVEPAPVNTKVWDFGCPSCKLRIQLKAKSGRFTGSFQNSAYAPKLAAIKARELPDYALLSYDADEWVVTDLTLVPGHFIGERQVIPRKPLSATARRAGWQGSVVMLKGLPPDALVRVVESSLPRKADTVRAHYKRFEWLRAQRAESAGWTADVLREVRRLAPLAGMRFTLHDLYTSAEARLAAQHPRNKHVRDKVRQQLQVLRDRGVVYFEERGRYVTR